jgi:hypothetical protein
VSTLGHHALRTTLVCLAGLVGGLGAVGLPGCAMGGPQMTPGVQFTLGAVVSDAPSSAGAPVGAAASAVATPAHSMVRVRGIATEPTTVGKVLNVQDGKVSGTPVEVRDALSGKLMAKGVTYYDGSFLVDVPWVGSQRSAIVSIDLVARDGETRTSLLAPVVLRKGQDETTVTLTPGSTALMAFLAEVSTDGLAAGGGPLLSDMIANFEPDDQSRFASLAESAPEISQASSVATFESGIRQYVGRLRGRTSRGVAQATVATANGL